MADWLNISMLENMTYGMFLNVFGNSIVVFVFVLGFFAFLCHSGRFSVEESGLVFLPLLVGIIMDGWLPIWVKALFVVAIAVVWAMAFMRIVREA